jgi:hypothetical protein
MPEYSLYCEGCNFGFTRTWKFNEYDKKLKNVKCPNCNTKKKVYRDFNADNVTPNYIKGLHEAKTVGEYADKQTKLYGKYQVEDMSESFVTKPENTLEEKLPDGMSLSKKDGSLPSLSKSEIQKKRKGKKNE